LIAGAEERQQTITENDNPFAIVVVVLKYNEAHQLEENEM
jgi:hypothetical protein